MRSLKFCYIYLQAKHFRIKEQLLSALPCPRTTKYKAMHLISEKLLQPQIKKYKGLTENLTLCILLAGSRNWNCLWQILFHWLKAYLSFLFCFIADIYFKSTCSILWLWFFRSLLQLVINCRFWCRNSLFWVSLLGWTRY